MMNCPPVLSSLQALKSTVLSGDFQLTPSVDADEDGDPNPEADLSLEVLDRCKRAKAAMGRPLEDWGREMFDACMEREKLSETVLVPIEAGVDRGFYGIEALKVKPHWSYRYRVDRAMNVRGIDAWTVDGLWKTLEPKHFTWFSWEPREDDPRGDSLGDAIFHAFNMLMQLWPEFYEGNRKFGTPSLMLTTGEKSAPMVSPRGPKGEEIPGSKPVTGEFALSVQGSKLKGGGVIAASYGATGKVLESTRDGVGMNAAIAVLEAQIIVCFVLNTRVLREAEYGSKADSESGTGVLTTYAQSVRTSLCRAARRPFRYLVEANYDADVAARHTPNVTLGKTDPRTFAAVAQSLGVLYQSGFFTERQLHWLDAYLGLPQRRPGDARVGPQKDNAVAPPAPPPVKAAFRDVLDEAKGSLIEKGMPS